jgi:hypothetical protein
VCLGCWTYREEGVQALSLRRYVSGLGVDTWRLTPRRRILEAPACIIINSKSTQIYITRNDDRKGQIKGNGRTDARRAHRIGYL